jgi:AAA15 family ATPase/GTPase
LQSKLYPADPKNIPIDALMEKLTITNFLSIDHAEIEIKPINLFIGPQAQGKSVIAKLIYFFKDYPQTLVEAIYRGIATKEDGDKLALAKFEKIFPKYTWEKHEFTVTYTNKYYSVSIANKPGKSSLLALTSDSVIRDAFDKFKKEVNDDAAFAEFHFVNGFNQTLFNLISKMLQPSEAKPLGEAQRRWRQRSGAWEACRAGTDG